MKIESLKEQARQHEQREEWAKAMQLYSRAIERASEEDDTDIALHNRLGDLRVRVGDIEGAIDSYETAIDLYLEADLANNAMAVCRKLERNAPNRPEVLLRMGQIRVRQGFVVDARQDFLSYAEIQLAGGDVDEALAALEEFTSLAPSDVETRLFLAEHLHRVERTDDAVGHFRQAYRTLVREGRQEEADEVRARVAEIAPQVDLDELPSDVGEDAPSSASGREGSAGLSGFETTALSGLELEDPAGPAQGDAAAAGEPSLPDGSDEESPEPEEQASVEGSGPSEPEEAGPEGDDGAERLASLERTVFELDDDEPPDEGNVPLPELGDQLDDEGVDWEGPADLPYLEDPDDAGAVAGTDTAAASAPGGDPGPPQPSSTDAPGPFPGGPDVMVESEGASVDELQARVREAPADGDAWRRLGVALFEEGRDEEAREALERAHRAYDDGGDPERGMRVVRELIFREPEEVSHYQRLVEYAHKTGDRALLVPAFLELGDVLARTGAPTKAKAVYGQVLELDPRNPRAREALSGGGARGDFVDLGGMVLDEEKRDSYRWKLSDADPSGDEEADFARMLTRFKAKVARDVPSDDATAHYDLGAAYKDMGLLDEAVGQFQQAIRAHPTHLAAYEMVGQCFLEQERPEAAVRSLRRALEVDWAVEDELVGIYYFLGQAYEAVGERESAVEYYERVFSLDINFKDVTERLRVLR